MFVERHGTRCWFSNENIIVHRPVLHKSFLPKYYAYMSNTAVRQFSIKKYYRWVDWNFYRIHIVYVCGKTAGSSVSRLEMQFIIETI